MLFLRIFQLVFLLTAFKSYSTNGAEVAENSDTWVDQHQERKSGTEDEARPWRLPNTTYPLQYHLHLITQVHREIYAFSGNCTIEIQVRESTNELVLHGQNLKIKSIAAVDLTTNQPIEKLVYIPYEPKELLIVKREDSSSTTTPTFVQEHHLRLTILYTGVITEGEGYEILREGETDHGVAAQFKPMYARLTLPCYDEPSFKANFSLRLTYGSDFNAISNMPKLKTDVDSEHGMTTTTFVETPPMSTFVLTFVITNYKYVSLTPETANDIGQGFLIPPKFDEVDIVDNLREYGDVVELFGKWMAIPYPLPKIDQVQSTHGNLDNWGIVTYAAEDRRVRNRRIANLWFGNLVSPAWWNSVWISEGLATYFGYALSEMLEVYKVQTFNAIEHFDMDTCISVFMAPTDEPISLYSEETMEGGDYYKKFYDSNKRASCVIQMFEHAFTDDVFEKGVAKYLNKYAYSVADENNFYDELQSAAVSYYSNLSINWDHNIHDIFKTWAHNRGIPTVTITRNYKDNTIKIHQKGQNNSDELWWIPLNFATKSMPNFDRTKADYFMPPVAEVTLDLSTLNITLKADDWLIVNKQGRGFYAVSYDAENMHKIVAALQQDHKAIHKNSRGYLLRNIVKLWIDHDKSVDLQTALELVKYLSKEEDLFVQNMAKLVLQMVMTFTENTEIYDKLKSYMHHAIVAKWYREHKTTKPDEVSNMDDFPTIACEVELPECLLEHKTKILNEISGKEESKTDNHNGNLCYAVKTFDDEEYDRAVQFFASKDRWARLACTKNEKQYEKLLHEVFDFSTNMDSKLKFVADFPFLKQVSGRKTTWKLWDQHISKVADISKEQLKSFCDHLQHSVSYAVVRKSERVAEAVDLCKRSIQYEFKESEVKNQEESFESMQQWFVDNLIDEEVNKWLQKEVPNK